jgi:hypothetical protein
MHDKAFEAGLYTLDAQLRVVPSPKALASDWATAEIVPYAGRSIKSGNTPPSLDSLQQHWHRKRVSPKSHP